MREIVFIERHEDRWRSIEGRLGRTSSVDPDVLASDYVSVIDDLAYARAQYPTSLTTEYLNQLAALAHSALARNRRAHVRGTATYWLSTVPLSFLAIRQDILISLGGLLFMSVVGFLAGITDESFIRLILSNAYVDMTISNIEAGHPMNVYASRDGWQMFAGIAINNLFVMLRVVALGLIPIVGVMGSVVYHGLMIGSFFALFANHSVLETSFLAVFVHGAFELSCLVVTAAAGLHAGMSYVNPGTLPRQTAFIQAARRSITIAIGMIPFIIAAAILEGFVTRWSDMPLLLNLVIIVGSFVLIWGYVSILPTFLIKKAHAHARTRTPVA
ncbi:MAG TPA: stage II sporulation protein M [Candidatus Didemnitutus sp.]|nr:stage II sporulation protein M [Candidatus Didemnitutus sp.]